MDHANDLRKKTVSNFLAGKGVRPKLEKWILEYGVLWKDLRNKMKKDDRGVWRIAEWNKVYADLKQKRKVFRFPLKSNGVARPWQSWIMSHDATWRHLYRKMGTGGVITDWDIIFKDLQRKELSEFLSRKRVPDDWKEWIMSQTVIWKRLAGIMKCNKINLDMFISNWAGEFQGLLRTEVSDFLSKKTVTETWKKMIMSQEGTWKKLANKMKCKKSGNMTISNWAGELQDIQQRELTRLLSRKRVADYWRKWLMGQEDIRTDLVSKMRYNSTGKTYIARWDTTFTDHKKRLVRIFLEENKVERAWQDFFNDNDVLWNALAYSIIRHDLLIQQNKRLHPPRKQILAAFRYCPKSKLKVILVGHEPIVDATGLAFSYAKGTKESDITNNSAVVKIHRVLRRVNNTDAPKANDTSCCHVKWATKGVLLLNYALTPRIKSENIWHGFVREVMSAILKKSQSRIIVVFWGRFAKHLHKELVFIGFPYRSCHSFYKWLHPAERKGLFPDKAAKPIIAIKKVWPDLLALERVQESDTTQELNGDDSEDGVSTSEEDNSGETLEESESDDNVDDDNMQDEEEDDGTDE